MKAQEASADYKDSQVLEVIQTVICIKGLLNMRLVFVM
jgi:hypothetical protein